MISVKEIDIKNGMFNFSMTWSIQKIPWSKENPGTWKVIRKYSYLLN